jgi:MipA family protein
MKKLVYLALLLASAMASTSAFAQTSDLVNLTPTPYLAKNANYSVGAAILSVPKYTGSDERRFVAYPNFNFQWKNGAFFGASSGLGYNFSKDPALQYGLRISMEGARDIDRSSKLKGLDDISTSIEPGVFFNMHLIHTVTLMSSVRYGSGVDHNATQATIGVRASHPLNDKHRITGSLATNWSDQRYMDSYFGVNQAQASASGYAQFKPKAGLSDVRLGVNWIYKLDDEWSIANGFSYKRLIRDAAKSPFVFLENQVSVFSAASYQF